VVCAAVIRAIPSGVRGPVLPPPCIRHRPFAIAGARQAQPVLRARAPHRGARFRPGLPSGLPRRQWLASPVPPARDAGMLDCCPADSCMAPMSALTAPPRLGARRRRRARRER
jgi:hypothetical protein